MFPPPTAVLPTARISPKNQVTIPREARFLRGQSEATHLRALKHGQRKPETGEVFPMLLMMTEAELQRREQRILDDAQLTGDQRLALVTRLNAGSATLAIDSQNRVVLPADFITYLGVERDVSFVTTNTTVQVWHPEHFLRWHGAPAGPLHDPVLATYLAI
jgi:DNA-binding transcriptional regulator/RsmH inhibitor MraZ